MITFEVSPRFDLFYALYILADPAVSAVEQWKVHALERLPNGFEELARRVAPRPIFWPLLADALQDSDGALTFAEIIEDLGRLSPANLVANILSGIFHEPRIVRSLASGKTRLRHMAEANHGPSGRLLSHFGLRPYDPRSPSVRTISELLARPDVFRDKLVAALDEFWNSSFQNDWTVLEPRLRAESLEMRELQETLALEELTQELRLPATFDKGAREVRPKHGPAIPYDRIGHCYVLPSAFNALRWWARYETKRGLVNLYFPVFRERVAANFRSQSRSSATAPSSESRSLRAELVFRALGDTTRYAIASILARTPTTSAELARSLSVSKPTITHHIQTLRRAGLIQESPVAGATKLSLSREAVAALSQAAVDQLFSATGDLSLDTTRKRRSS